MKTLIKISILFSIFIIINNTYANNETLYEQYLNNISNRCEKADYYINQATDVENQPVLQTEDYLSPKEYMSKSFLKKTKLKFKTDDKALLPFVVAKAKYRFDQNQIYKCGIYQSQITSLKIVSNLLKIDSTWALKDRLENKIKSKIEIIETKRDKIECIKDKWLKLFKKKILDQSTYEYCKYSYYLKFLDYYYADIKNLFWITPWEADDLEDKKIDISSITNKRSEILEKIKNEKKHTNKMYDFAFDAYVQYENYLQIHIILELLKDDFIVLRTKLYQTLNPINQVVYKIINAMSK